MSQQHFTGGNFSNDTFPRGGRNTLAHIRVMINVRYFQFVSEVIQCNMFGYY